MAATIEISNGLLNSGSIDYLMGGVSASIKQLPATGVLVAIIGVSLLSHLLINSRTARVTVLLPLLLPMAVAVGQSGALLAFIANAAMGYCLTLTISAKPVALFSTIDEDSYSSRDLLRLSGYLLPLHLVLLIGTYYAYAALGW
jgi:solute carrier family 13 (sodium-dependent dicarboxylate transporter), member 2/3/5